MSFEHVPLLSSALKTTFFLLVKRHYLQGWCLVGVQGVLRRVWRAREDAQAPGERG